MTNKDNDTAFKAFMHHIASYRLEVHCAMDGDLTSKIAIVGEYPGEQEAAFNKPFTGGSGKMMWDKLRKQGINRFDCYTTYAVKRRVTKKTAVNTHEFSLWKEALIHELNQLPNLKYVICLGNAALEALTSNSGITQYRGSVYTSDEGYQIICSYNPSTLMRQPQNEVVFALDMEKAKNVINGDYEPHEVNTVINPSFTDAMDYIGDIQKSHKRFAMDIECIGMETACLGLAHSPHDAMCINFRDDKTNRYTEAEEYRILRAYADLCDDPTTTSIAQNGNFDSYFMGFKDHCLFRVNFDTLLAHHTLYPKLPHNLGFLTAQYTNHPYYKDDISIYKEGGDINSFWRYNGTDCAITFAVAEKEEEELRDQGLLDFFTSHVMRLQPHLSKATVTGVAVDLETKRKLSHDLGDDVQLLRSKLNKTAQDLIHDPDFEINPNSPKQLCEFLFDKLGCQASKRSADANTRDEILKDPRTSPDTKNFITSLGHYAEEKKFLSTYVNTKIDDDGRFRAEFKQYGVTRAPGRLSSGGTLWGSGGNAQNQPYRAYEMYKPDDGCIFFYFDLAQAEARYVGWDANIEQWIEDFERARLDGNFDAHRSLAATMFKKPYDEVAKDDIQDAAGRGPSHPDFDKTTANVTERFIAKRCRHGLNYRMHIARLAQTTGLSYGLAAQNYYLYHRTSPELQLWWKELEREVRKTRMQFNCFGRRNIFLEKLQGDGAMDSIVAFKPQSSIGDKCQKVWYQCHEDDRWDHQKARICLNVHDALYGIATPDFAKTALSIAKAYAEEPLMITSTMTKKTTPMIIPADCKLSIAGEKDGIHRMSTMKTFDIEAATI